MLKDIIRTRREHLSEKHPEADRDAFGADGAKEEGGKAAAHGGSGISREFTDGIRSLAQAGRAKLGFPEVPDDCYRKCNFCGKAILNSDVRDNDFRCPKCGGYFRMDARSRIGLIADAGSFREHDRELPFVNPLEFPGYEEKVRASREKFGIDEAVVAGHCTICGEAAVLCVCDSRFIMSSMGHNVGEKITRAAEYATRERLPLVIYCCSGGARMQEGIISLMQMAKTAAAIRQHHDAGLFYLSILTNPTTGGVTASFAMLGDVILAEPKALIGFAGPRVIEQTIRQKLPEGFQRAEFLLSHGFVDAIVGRKEQKETIAFLIRAYDRKRISEAANALRAGAEAACLEEAGGKTLPDGKAEGACSAWERVQISRSAERPKALEYISRIFDRFLELHGDRAFGDDGAIVGGIAELCGMPVTVIAEQKGRDTKENLKRNFGMPSPEGYRKALRLMREADAAGRPVICFVDTPGAYPGLESEERGQGEAIARCLYELSGLRVPVLSLVISEGGSGGALALAAANAVWMMENAVYSILSPEGFASILYKDAKRAREAAEQMKLTSADLLRLGVIERIIPEEAPLSPETLPETCAGLKQEMAAYLGRASALSPEELRAQRNRKFRIL